jgi:hypothetical protein
MFAEQGGEAIGLMPVKVLGSFAKQDRLFLQNWLEEVPGRLPVMFAEQEGGGGGGLGGGGGDGGAGGGEGGGGLQNKSSVSVQ